MQALHTPQRRQGVRNQRMARELHVLLGADRTGAHADAGARNQREQTGLARRGSCVHRGDSRIHIDDASVVTANPPVFRT
jgi:hypothetical protein